MQHLGGSGTPVLYIGRTVLKVKLHLCFHICPSGMQRDGFIFPIYSGDSFEVKVDMH